MKKPSSKLSRIHKLRVIEHRVAAVRSAQTHTVLNNLLHMSQRLASLKHGLTPLAGYTSGGTLQSNAEMLIRLESASNSIESPICEARMRHSENNEMRISARQKEDSAAKLLNKATSAEAIAYTLRTDANRPYRKLSAMLEDDV